MCQIGPVFTKVKPRSFVGWRVWKLAPSYTRAGLLPFTGTTHVPPYWRWGRHNHLFRGERLPLWKTWDKHGFWAITSFRKLRDQFQEHVAASAYGVVRLRGRVIRHQGARGSQAEVLCVVIPPSRKHELEVRTIEALRRQGIPVVSAQEARRIYRTAKQEERKKR